MRAFRKKMLVTTLCLVVSVFALAGVSHAKKGGGGSSTVTTKFEAKLQPSPQSACNTVATFPEPNAEGEAKREIRTIISTGAVSRDEFTGTVEIPVDPTNSNGLGITDEASAMAALVQLELSHCAGATPTLYARCTLAFDEIEIEEEEDEEEEGGSVAEYKVDLRFRRGAFTAKKGSCTDLTGTGAGLQNGGIPAVQDGDDVAAKVVITGPTDVFFLDGEFMLQ